MMSTASRSAWRILRRVCLMIVACATGAPAATLPAGFTESLVASGLNHPTAMQFAPDGRLFVCEQGGRLRVIRNGSLLSMPFLTVTASIAKTVVPAARLYPTP
jgi:glucose/arabinose dehydrogenase